MCIDSFELLALLGCCAGNLCDNCPGTYNPNQRYNCGPRNDYYANAMVLALPKHSNITTVTGTNKRASAEPNEPINPVRRT